MLSVATAARLSLSKHQQFSSNNVGHALRTWDKVTTSLLQAGALPFLRRMRPRGGKMDDVTVVVGFVQQAGARRRTSAPRDGRHLATIGRT